MYLKIHNTYFEAKKQVGEHVEKSPEPKNYRLKEYNKSYLLRFYSCLSFTNFYLFLYSPLCGNQYTDKKSLQKHQRIHHPEAWAQRPKGRPKRWKSQWYQISNTILDMQIKTIVLIRNHSSMNTNTSFENAFTHLRIEGLHCKCL